MVYWIESIFLYGNCINILNILNITQKYVLKVILYMPKLLSEMVFALLATYFY